MPRFRKSIVLALALVAGAAVPSAGAAPASPTDGKRLVWADEFNSTDVRWGTCYPWWPKTSPGCTNEGNPDERQWYVPGAVTAANGSLRLTARRSDTVGTFRGAPKTYAYTSGMVQSRSIFSFTYGYAEFRMKLPAGTGMWDAAWLLPVDWRRKGEIDVFEGYGQYPRGLALTYHSPDGRRFRREIADGLADTTTGYHTYGIDWEPSKLTWYVDGTPQFVSNNPTPSEPMYLLMNLAIAGRYTTPSTPSTGTVLVDWVRVWQQRSPG